MTLPGANVLWATWAWPRPVAVSAEAGNGSDDGCTVVETTTQPAALGPQPRLGEVTGAILRSQHYILLRTCHIKIPLAAYV